MKSQLIQLFYRARTTKVHLPTVIFILIAIDVLCFLAAFMQLVYRDVPFNEYLSYTAKDKPQLADYFDFSGKSVGVHYFGDYLQPWYWATHQNPWTFDPDFLVQYPSVPLFVFKIFTIFPYKVGLAIYLLVIAGSSFLGSWWLTKKMDFGLRVGLATTFGLASSTFFAAFDRGNIVGALPLLFALFLSAYLSGNKTLAGITLGIMACLKVYPAVLLILFIRRRWWSTIALTIGGSLLLTSALFALTPGSLLETITQFASANLQSISNFSESNSSQIAKSFSKVFNLDKAQFAAIEAISSVALAAFRYSVLAALASLVLFSKRLNSLQAVILTGFACSVFYSAQLTYNWFWVPVAATALFVDFYRRNTVTLPVGDFWQEEKLNIVLFAALTLITLPLGLHLPGVAAPLTPYLGLLGALAAICATLGCLYKGKSRLKAASGAREKVEG